MKKSTSLYSVKTADLRNDKELIIDVWKEGLHHESPGEIYDWILKDSPFDENYVFLLCAHDESGNENAAGVITISSREWKCNKHPNHLLLLGDFVVKKEHRSIKPAVQLAKEMIAATEHSHKYGFPNRSAVGVLKRAGFTAVGEFARHAKVIHSGKKISERFGSKYPKFITFAIGFVADQFLWAEDYLKYRSSRAQCISRIEKVNTFDERFDELSKQSDLGKFRTRRSKEYLEWKYIKGPARTPECWVMIDKQDEGRLAGYVLFNHKGKEVIIEDAYARDNKSYFEAVLSAFFLKLRDNQVHTVSFEVMGDKFVMNTLYAMRFKKREGKQFCFKPKKDDTEFTNLSKEDFYLTPADEDQ